MTTSAAAHTFLFADLAGFTAMTEVHGDEFAADVATEFCAEVNRLLPHGAEDFKGLGDACLIHASEAGPAVRLGVDLTDAMAGRHGGLGVSVGVHTGSAVRRGGDWYGRGVNLAERPVCARARDRPPLGFADYSL